MAVYPSEFRIIRKRIFNGGPKFCEICNKVETGRSHHLHHKDGNTHNNHEDNLQILCGSCHRHSHRQTPLFNMPDDLREGEFFCRSCEYRWIARVIKPKSCPRCKERRYVSP